MEFLLFDYSIKVWEGLAVLGVVLIALEIFAPGFILLPIGLAFLGAAVAAVFLSTWLSVLVALAVSLCFLIWLFQFKLKLGDKSRAVVDTNADGMIGEEITVTVKIEGVDFGEVKLYGDVWRAYSLSKRTYEINERALIVEVDGNKIALT